MSGQSTEVGSVRYIWSEQHKQYSEYRYNGRTWDFVAWKGPGWQPPPQQPSSPATPRPGRRPPDSAYGSSPAGPTTSPGPSNWPPQLAASGQHASAHPSYTSRGSAFPRGEGALVRGHYSAQLGTQPGNLHYEELDPLYYVRDRRYFVEGKVFSVMFNETAGETATAYNKSISEVRFSGNRVYTSARRFVVVRVKREFCYACPIFTYSNRATTKDGVRPEEHGVVYSYGREAKLVDDERGIVKPSIAVEMASGEPPLHVASRIYYGIHHPVQYNVKVKHIGQVIDNHLPALIGNWKAEDNGETKQAADVTASADDDDLPEIPEERLSEENAPYSKSLGKTPAKEAPPRPPSPDMFLYHPTNNIYGFDKKINPQVYHPVQNPYGYHPTHNQLGYHPSSTPYNYHPDHNIYGYHPEYNPHGYHPTANITGYHPSTNLYSYHPLHNSIGHHSSSNPYSYHPIHNPHGYHPQKAPFCWHPQLCPYGYHAQRNPSGFHPLVMPGNFHPEVNPLGYHPSHKAHEYHPRHNMYAYHKTHNPSGFHPKHNAYGYHPTQNQHAYHAQQNPFGYHPTYYPNSYHPTYQPAGTLYDRSGKIIEDSDDEDPDEGETGDEHEDEDEDEDENDDADELYVG